MKDKTDITIQTYDNIVSEYIAYFKTKELKGKVQFQREIDFLCSELKGGAKILDVGTAIGDYPKYLTEKCDKYFEVIGIDSSKNMIKEAIKNAPKAHFEVMDMRKLTFPPKTFDAILCFATLIHVENEVCVKILDKFNELLKENGMIIINVQEWLGKEKEKFVDEPFNANYKTYYNRYKKEFFIEYFQNKNYDILSFYDNPIFNSSVLKKRMDGRKSIFNNSKKKGGKFMIKNMIFDLSEVIISGYYGTEDLIEKNIK